MSSLLFRHNLSLDVLRPYLRGYKHDLPIAPDQWAQAESLGLPIGSLVVSLEAVSMTGEEADDQQTYKVAELSVVVGVEGERPIVLVVSREAYELTFLEGVMAKRANDARLTGWDYSYIIIEPAHALPDEKVHEIEEIGLSFARGGSRRERHSDGAGIMDPAIPLLTALGLELDSAAAQKMLDLGAFVFFVFEAPEPGTDTPLKAAKDCFRPVPTAGNPAPEALPEEAPSAVSVPAKEQGPVDVAPLGAAPAMEPPPEPAPAMPEPAEETADLAQQGKRFHRVVEEKKDDLQKLLGLGGIFSADSATPAETAADRAAKEPPASESAKEASRMRVVRPPSPAQAPLAIPQGERSRVAPSVPVVPPRKAVEPPRPSAAQQRPATHKPEPTSTAGAAEPAGAEDKSQTGTSQAGATTWRATGAMPAARTAGLGKLPFKETAGVTDPMGSLVAKLEQQVEKATARLAVQVEELHNKLEKQLRDLVTEATGTEEKAEQGLAATLADLCHQLDDVGEDAEHKLADCAAHGRYEIKQLQDKSQSGINDHQKSHLQALQGFCTDLKNLSRELSEKIKTDFGGLVDARSGELKSMVDAICQRLSESTKGDVDRLKTRFEQLSERLAAESEAILRSFGRQTSSLAEDLNSVCERAREKLNAIKTQCSLGVQQAKTSYELDISRTVNNLASATLLPHLREHRNTLKQTVSDLQKRFSEEFGGLIFAQLTEIASQTSATKQEILALASHTTSRMEATAAEQRAEIGNIFEAAATSMEAAIARAASLFHDAEEIATTQDRATRDLVEQWSSGADPSLLADRDAATEALNRLKAAAQRDLTTVLDARAEKLEQHAQEVQAAMLSMREARVQAVRDTAQQAIQQVRDALQEAFQVIQLTREHYLE